MAKLLEWADQALLGGEDRELTTKLRSLYWSKLRDSIGFCCHPPSNSRRPAYIKDHFLGGHSGQLTIFVIAATVLLFICAWCWESTGGDANYDDSFGQAMWLSWGVFFDPGTQTG